MTKGWFHFDANIAIPMIIIDKTVFVKIINGFSALLGLILTIRYIPISFAKFQGLKIFPGAIAGIGTALVDIRLQGIFWPTLI